MMKRIFNDHDARPWWVALAVLLVLLGCVQYAGAYRSDFKSDTIGKLPDDWANSGGVVGSHYYIAAYPYTEFKTYFCWPASTTGRITWYDVSTPTTYWALTGFRGGAGSVGYRFFWLDSGKTRIFDTPVIYRSDTSVRFEFWRSGGDMYYSINGATPVNMGACPNTPYYFGISTDEGSSNYDHVVIGPDEDRNFVVTIPDSWFVAKDIFQSEFSGVYDVPDHQIYVNTLRATYCVDGGSGTIKMEHIPSGFVVNTTPVNTYTGIISYNVSSILFESGAPYGFYKIYVEGSEFGFDEFVYKAIATSGTAIQWDDSTYDDGDTATITFAISESNWYTDYYSYELRILDSDLSEIYSKSIASRPVNATQEIDITTALFPITGTYYATLYATDLSSGEEILLAYDDAYMYFAGSGVVTVSGKTYYAVNNSVVGGADVNITQLGVTHETTSNVTDGTYEVVDLITDWSIGCNASLTGYESYEVFFTPLAGGEYNVDLLLVPTGGPQPGNWYDVTGGQMTADSSGSDTTDYWNATLNGTSVGGIVYEAPYWNPASGALVNISNSTWSDTALIGAGGWYQFDNLTQSQYSLSISKTGFATCSGTVTPLENQFTRKDAYLEIEYTLTVNAKDLASLGLITGDTVTISLSTGQSDTTTTGSVTFTGLSYNVYDVVASCEGYYAGYSTIILNEDMTVDVYLQSMGDSSSGPSANYIPHPVRFTYVDATGNPITGATVTAIAQESSNPWSWLSSVFGFNTNLTNINTTLSGTTGHDGTLSFLMVETVQYEVHCVKASAGINHTVDIYPKESEYFIRIGSLPSVGSNYPTYSLNATTVGTNVVLFGNYSDTSGSTTAAYFVVLNSTGSEVHNSSITLTGGVGSAYFAVNNTKGDQYREGIVAFHSTEGTIEKWIDVTLKGSGRLVDFGEGWTDFMYLVMAVAGIFLVAGCFGEIDVKLGAFFVPLMGSFFLFIGWLPLQYAAFISIAGFLGGLYYIRGKLGELWK